MNKIIQLYRYIIKQNINSCNLFSINSIISFNIFISIILFMLLFIYYKKIKTYLFKIKLKKKNNKILKKKASVTIIKKQKLVTIFNNALKKTNIKITNSLNNHIYNTKTINNKTIENLESFLFSIDIGFKTSTKLINIIKKNIINNTIKSDTDVKNILKEEIHAILSKNHKNKSIILNEFPYVIMFIGVNGAGKTTTIGKMAKMFRLQGKKVILGAGDTFRTAAFEQLNILATKTNSIIVSSVTSKDPASVLFNTVKKANNIGSHIVLCDTAGRLHTKINLMKQLKKIYNALGKAKQGSPHEVFLTLDATTGQNAIIQAKEFSKIIPISGIILTKLDGTAKGGIIISIIDELHIPIKYIGLGEKLNDLYKFNEQLFVNAIFNKYN